MKEKIPSCCQVVCHFALILTFNTERWIWSDSWRRVIYTVRALCYTILFRFWGTWHKDPPLLSTAWECTAGMAMDLLFVKHPWISPQAFYQRGSICESNCSPAVHLLPAGSYSIKSLLILLVTLHPWWVRTKLFLLYYSLTHEIPQDKSLKFL